MTFEEYRRYDALGLADLVKKGAVKSSELLDLASHQIAAVNPQINAVIHSMEDTARAEIPADGPFQGVPFLVKDLGPAIDNQPMRFGCKGFEKYTPPRDSYVTQKMRKAGLVLLGKTNTPEFGLTPYTEPLSQGATRNPWNLAHTSGGSSGGSAAAVAAGIVPMATANDGGGSIRIPASCCGLFGLKPSRGRVSWGPLIGDMWNGAAVEGCVSRSVRDSAAYLDAICGGMPGDPYFLPQPERSYLSETQAVAVRLKIGFTLETPIGTPIDDACSAAIAKMVTTLRELGHTVEEVPSFYTKADLTEAFLPIVASETAGELRLLAMFLGRKVRPSDVEPNTYALHLMGKNLTGGDYAFAKKRWNDLSQRAADFHAKYDLLLTPTLGYRPFKIGSLQNSTAENILVSIVNTFGLGGVMRLGVNDLAAKIYGWMPWTAMANMTGQPSMSIPTLITETEQLPVGTMFTAPLGREDILFRLAAALEGALRWDDRKATI